MADFRRIATVLAVLVVLTGLASAQTAPNLNCIAQAAVPPLLRAEGLTELAGDIYIDCTGGVFGSVFQANVSVFFGNTSVTSRILDTTTNASDAVLLINEPTTGLSGADAAYSICTTPLSGCGTVTNFNTFQGLVSGNSVTFIGVPIAPPGTLGHRIFRIANVRVNATTIGGGPGGTPGQVQAFISISGSQSVPLTNPTQIVGFVQNGMTFGLRKSSDFTSGLSSSGVSFAQCNKLSTSIQAVARFSENFATAFKIRRFATQSVPGSVYNTESGLIFDGSGPGMPAISASSLGGTTYAGLADSGTRLRLTFASIPAGVTVYVSTQNLNNAATVLATNSTSSAFAVLTATEVGPFVAVTPTTSVNSNAVNLAPVTLDSTGRGVAVYEVLGSNALLSENFDFGIYFAFAANPGSNSPASGVQGTVAGSFAPAPPAIDATAGAKASATLPIPRFVDTGSGKSVITINICRTNLLFPFVTNQGGFDTGLAIANTSKDPFGTTTQTGTCTLNFYGDSAPAAFTTPANVEAGTVYANTATNLAPGFQGYVIAVCNFQMAHGFAFVSDVGARNLAMGYLALVMPDPGRQVPAVSITGTGEVLGQ